MGKQVFVGNLDYKATEDDLRDAFEAEGFPVDEARVVRDMDTGLSRGFGFVTIGDTAKVELVVERMNGMKVQSRKISVEQARGVAQRRRQ